jgi:S-phase kinase-associated protein 1
MAETITLQSSDGQDFTLDIKAAKLSKTVCNLLEDLGDASHVIPVPDISGVYLAKVVEYCRYHTLEEPRFETEPAKDRYDSSNMLPWDIAFTQVDIDVLCHLLLAASYMDIPPMTDMVTKAMANLIHGKTPEEIRTAFKITKDFTPEELEQLNRENEWVPEPEASGKE